MAVAMRETARARLSSVGRSEKPMTILPWVRSISSVTRRTSAGVFCSMSKSGVMGWRFRCSIACRKASWKMPVIESPAEGPIMVISTAAVDSMVSKQAAALSGVMASTSSA